MSFKTIFIIVVTILLTVIFMQNTSAVNVKILLWDLRVSFVLLMLSIAILCFLMGYFAAYRNRRTASIAASDNQKTLNDDDRNYIE